LIYAAFILALLTIFCSAIPDSLFLFTSQFGGIGGGSAVDDNYEDGQW